MRCPLQRIDGAGNVALQALQQGKVEPGQPQVRPQDKRLTIGGGRSFIFTASLQGVSEVHMKLGRHAPPEPEDKLDGPRDLIGG